MTHRLPLMGMIKTFRHRGLKELFESGFTGRVNRDWQAKPIRQMDALDSAARLDDMNILGWRFHALRGRPVRYSVAVNANWRLTFEWHAGDAYRLNLEDYR